MIEIFGLYKTNAGIHVDRQRSLVGGGRGNQSQARTIHMSMLHGGRGTVHTVTSSQTSQYQIDFEVYKLELATKL